MPSKPCVECSKHKPIHAFGRCHACADTYVSENGLDPSLRPARCEVESCSRFAEKGSLCDIHYRRKVDHGHTDKVRQQGKSEIRQHPYFKNWEHLKRQKILCSAWSDFSVFIRDIGERPSPRHRLERPNGSALYGPDNFNWFGPRFAETYNFSEERSVYQKRVDEMYKQKELKRDTRAETLRYSYNITKEQYETLLDAQGGTCVFCDKQFDRGHNGMAIPLAVDHDHNTGEIRGLLCRNHNMMLGFADDRVEVLEAAIAYLRHENHTGWFATVAGDEAKRYARPFAFDAERVSNKCNVDGCERSVKARGLCGAHYMYLKRTGSVEKPVRVIKACSEPDCNRPVVARGLCNNHYARLYAQGKFRKPETAMGTERANSLHSSSLVCDNPVSLRGDSVPSDVPPIGV